MWTSQHMRGSQLPNKTQFYFVLLSSYKEHNAQKRPFPQEHEKCLK